LRGTSAVAAAKLAEENVKAKPNCLANEVKSRSLRKVLIAQ